MKKITNEDQVIKQAEALIVLQAEENKKDIKSVKIIFPKETRTNEIKNEMDEIKKWKGRIKRKDLMEMQININVIFNNVKQ